MKLPHLLTDEHSSHLILLLLATANLLLIVILFFFVLPATRQILPKIIPVSNQTPLVRFSLVSPAAESTVSGTAPLVTTMANGPKIVQAQLVIDGQKVQAVTSQKTNRLTLFWDTTKHVDGKHSVVISVADDQNKISNLSTSLNVRNDVSRTIGSR
jgi:hypothetical protein